MKKRIISLLLAASMIVTSVVTDTAALRAGQADPDSVVAVDYSQFTSDQVVKNYSFAAGIPDDAVFSRVEYPNAAKDWVSGVYYPREAVITREGRAM